MLRGALSLLRAPARAPGRPLVPARSWNQTTLFLSLPPRCPMSFGETVAHGAFMLVVWLVPTMIGLSQVKIWKRTYLQSA